MDDIRLAMYLGKSAEIISLRDYLDLTPQERERTAVSPSWCTVSLVVDDQEQWGAMLSLGALGILVAQLPQAAARIDNGERAVVRAGVFDVPAASFLVFEPSTGRNGARPRVVVTLARTDALSDPAWMPNGPRGEALYQYIDEHHDDLVAAATADGIGPQTIARARAGAALRREHELGTEVIRLLGEGGS